MRLTRHVRLFDRFDLRAASVQASPARGLPATCVPMESRPSFTLPMAGSGPAALWALLIAYLVLAGPFSTKRAVCGQSVGIHVSESAEETVVRITVSPAGEPRPALKYQLLPPYLERMRGNAAVYYGKAAAYGRDFLSDSKLMEAADEWTRASLKDLRGPSARQSPAFQRIDADSLFWTLLDQAARYRDCDWQLPLKKQPVWWIPLPDAQQSRTFARLLAARARLRIAQGRFDDAIRTLQSGYALSRHVAQGETLIQGLIGGAICGMMSHQVLELIQQPGAPNLYWALTMLPRPFVDLRDAIETEMNAVYVAFPVLTELDDDTHGAEYWRDSLFQLAQELEQADYSDGRATLRPELLLARAIRAYPRAKRALIDSGLSRERVEAMPVARVLLYYTKQTYEEIRDELFKWSFARYSETRRCRGLHERLPRLSLDREVVPLARVLLPAVQGACEAAVRQDREIAVLRTIEALRMYAANHKGRLPEKLTDLTVPIPLDPVTGQPFQYQRRENAAVIQGPTFRSMVLNVEVTVSKP
ncbi:MAG: hypothetical protein GXP27_02320 [Planctomycetes bacterium]|nr:hypothetical protein [Planctomycetota bacterium]